MKSNVATAKTGTKTEMSGKGGIVYPNRTRYAYTQTRRLAGGKLKMVGGPKMVSPESQMRTY